MSYYKTGDANLAALEKYYDKQAKDDAEWAMAEEEMEEIIKNIKAVYADDDLKDWRNKYQDFDGVDDYLKDVLWELVC